MHLRAIGAALAALALCVPVPASAQVAQTRAIVVSSCGSVTLPLNDPHDLYMTPDGRLCVAGGSSASAPTFTTPAGVTRTRLTCTLPAYASGGSIVCTDSAGAQTTTACAANTACLLSAANTARKTALLTVRTAGVTCDVGYSATVAPGNAVGIDGSATAGGQGGSLNETPAHVGAYFAACPSAATVVLVQGQ